REVDTIRKEDIEPEAVKHLLKYGHEKRFIEDFVKLYLRPLQTNARKNRKIKVDYLENRFFINMVTSGEYFVDDPEPYLTALLYEVMVKRDGTLPIPQIVLSGFSNCTGGFYKGLRSMAPMKRRFLAGESD